MYCGLNYGIWPLHLLQDKVDGNGIHVASVLRTSGIMDYHFTSIPNLIPKNNLEILLWRRKSTLMAILVISLCDIDTNNLHWN